MIEVEVEPVPEEAALRQVLAATKAAGLTPVRAPEGWISKLVTITKEEMATPVGIKIANVTPHPVILTISDASKKETGLEEGETPPSLPLSVCRTRWRRPATAADASCCLVSSPCLFCRRSYHCPGCQSRDSHRLDGKLH